jgi:hypothetical protein
MASMFICAFLEMACQRNDLNSCLIWRNWKKVPDVDALRTRHHAEAKTELGKEIMRLIFAAAVLICAQSVSSAESVYTSADLDKDCAIMEIDEVGGTWKCKGFGEYPVWFSEGDARQSIFLGHVGSWYRKGAWESFGQFNHYGGTVEWVLESGAPVAAITRFFVQNSEDPPSKDQGQVLVISKVGQPGAGEACVVGYVDARANKDPNVLAREVAAEFVKSFVCRKDEPIYHGVKGPTAGEPSRSFGE